MTDDTAARHSLYTGLEEVLGAENATRLMTYLPEHLGEKVATGSDIVRIDNRFDRLEERFDRLEEQFDRLEGRLNGLYETIIDQQTFYSRNTVWSMVGLTAIFSLVVAFFG